MPVFTVLTKQRNTLLCNETRGRIDDLQRVMVLSPNPKIELEVLRNNRLLSVVVRPATRALAA